MNQYVRNFLIFVFTLISLIAHVALATDLSNNTVHIKSTSLITADRNGIYVQSPNSPRQAVIKAKRHESFIDDTLLVSPNGEWAIIDYIYPNDATNTRVEEVTILVSVKNKKRFDINYFENKYGVSLTNSATWDKNAPATLILDRTNRQRTKRVDLTQ